MNRAMEMSTTIPASTEVVAGHEQVPLVVQLAEAREDWAQMSAKRQNRSFDRVIHGYNDAKKHYDELKLAYGRERLADQLADTVEPTERNRLAIQYLVDEDSRLREMSDRYAENSTGRRVSRVLGKWLTTGGRLTKVVKNMSVSVAGGTVGFFAGSTALGLGVANFARGYMTAERTGMGGSATDTDSILADIDSQTTGPGDIFETAGRATASRFESDIKGKQGEARGAIKRGLGKSAIGLVIGGVIDVAAAGTEAVASEYRGMELAAGPDMAVSADYQSPGLADTGVDLQHPGMAGLTDYDSPGMIGDGESYTNPWVIEQPDDYENPGMAEPIDYDNPGMIEPVDYQNPGMSADAAYDNPGMTDADADYENPGMAEVVDDTDDLPADEPAVAVPAPADAEIQLASDGQMFTGVNPELSYEELPVIDNGEGIISFMQDNYGIEVNNDQVNKLGEQFVESGDAYKSDYLLSEFGNEYGLAEPGQIDADMHNTILDYADDGEFNESYTVDSAVDTDTTVEPEIDTTDTAVDPSLVKDLEAIVDSGDYSQLNDLDAPGLKLDELAKALDGAEYSDGSPIVSLEDGEYKFKDQPTGATINSLSTVSTINDHIKGLSPDVSGAMRNAFDLAA